MKKKARLSANILFSLFILNLRGAAFQKHSAIKIIDHAISNCTTKINLFSCSHTNNYKQIKKRTNTKTKTKLDY